MGNHCCRLDKVQSKVNIGLIGYGRMGKIIESIAKDMYCEITSVIDPKCPQKSICETSVSNTDVLIDFSEPSVAVDNIKRAIDLQKNIVVGTTGWYDQIDEVQQLVTDAGIGMLYSPNFSIGFNLFNNIVSHAAQLIDHFDEYDIAGLESHHNKKIDIPSGTAYTLGETLLKCIERKKRVLYGDENYLDEGDVIHFPSVRCGNIPGTHTVTFDSPVDTITLTHQARNREGFARGALQAAAWLKGKTGFFTLEDMLMKGK